MSLTKRKIAGFTLIELMVVLAITSVVVIYQARRAKEKVENTLAEAAGDTTAEIGRALANYIANNTPALAVGANPFPVTVANLQAAGSCGGTAACLNAQFGPPNWAGGYTMQVRRLGAAAPFQYEAMACTDNGWTINGQLRGDLVGLAAMRIGAAGGKTWDATTGIFVVNQPIAQPLANYPFGNAAGKLCYFVSNTTSNLDGLYLRTDGQNQMNAALRMNNNAIQNAGDIQGTSATIAGAVAAGSMSATTNITAGGNMQAVNINAAGTMIANGQITGGSIVSNGDVTVAPGGALRSTGQLNIQAGDNLNLQPSDNGNGSRTFVGGSGGSGRIDATLVAATNVTATQAVSAGTNVTAGGNVTAVNNVSAGNDLVITSLTSRPNPSSTTSVKALLPTLVEVQSYTLNNDGQGIPVPVCQGGGAPRVFVIPNIVKGPVSAGNWGSDIGVNGSLGGPWSFRARYSDGTSMTPLAAPNFIALARVFCTY